MYKSMISIVCDLTTVQENYSPYFSTKCEKKGGESVQIIQEVLGEQLLGAGNIRTKANRCPEVLAPGGSPSFRPAASWESEWRDRRDAGRWRSPLGREGGRN